MAGKVLEKLRNSLCRDELLQIWTVTNTKISITYHLCIHWSSLKLSGWVLSIWLNLYSCFKIDSKTFIPRLIPRLVCFFIGGHLPWFKSLLISYWKNGPYLMGGQKNYFQCGHKGIYLTCGMQAFRGYFYWKDCTKNAFGDS